MTKNQSTKAISRSDWMRVVRSWAKAGSPAFAAECGDAVVERERLQPGRGLLEDQLQQAEAEHHRQNPQFLQQQGFGFLQFGEVDAEGVGVPHGSGGGQINTGHGCGAGLGLMIVGDGEGQPAQFAAHGAQLGERGAHEARVLADLQQRLRSWPAGCGQSIESGRQRLQMVPRQPPCGRRMPRDPGADGRFSSDACLRGRRRGADPAQGRPPAVAVR